MTAHVLKLISFFYLLHYPAMDSVSSVYSLGSKKMEELLWTLTASSPDSWHLKTFGENMIKIQFKLRMFFL